MAKYFKKHVFEELACGEIGNRVRKSGSGYKDCGSISVSKKTVSAPQLLVYGDVALPVLSSLETVV